MPAISKLVVTNPTAPPFPEVGCCFSLFLCGEWGGGGGFYSKDYAVLSGLLGLGYPVLGNTGLNFRTSGRESALESCCKAMLMVELLYPTMLLPQLRLSGV